MKYLLKRAIIAVLLLLMIWFGSIIAEKEYLHQRIIHLHILSKPDVSISSELVSSVRMIVSAFLDDKVTEICESKGLETCLPVDLFGLEQEIKSAFGNCNLKNEISVYWKKTKNTAMEALALNVPAGVFHTIEIHIGEIDRKEETIITILDSVFRGENIRSVLQKIDCSNYAVLNYIGYLENIFYLE